MAGVVRRFGHRTSRAPQRITGINWSSPLAHGLICAYVGQNHAGGSLFNMATGQFDGTFTNPEYAIDAQKGRVISLNGSDTAGQFNDRGHFASADMRSTPTSMECWVKAPASQNAYSVLLGNWDGNTQQWALHTWASGADIYGIFGGGQVDSGVNWTDQWQHVTMRADGTSTGGYLSVDGVDKLPGRTIGAEVLDIKMAFGARFSSGSPLDRYFQGLLDNVTLYDRYRSPEEVAASYRFPYDIYRTSSRAYFIPAAAGGPTTHTITPSGGVAFAGSGVYQYARTHDVSGGVQLAGSAALKATRIHDVSGGVQFAGTSTFNVSRDIVPDGGVQIGGSATQTNVRVHDVSGGLSFSGAAGMQATRVLSPSGGLSLGGTGNFTGVEAGLTIVPSGGIQFGGGASGTLWPDNLAYGGFAHRVARKVADDVTDDVTDFHRRYDD